jgi:hypothetical protein
MSASVISQPHHPGPLAVVARFPDFIALGLALPVFVLADWSIPGYVVAAITWFGQTVLITWMEQRAAHSTEVRQQVGLMVGGSLARAWISAAAILFAGLVFGESAGLACALLMIFLFTVYFAGKMLFHLLSEPTTTAKS